jgi:surface polysaccharide O-acyltransferase-like enzyme
MEATSPDREVEAQWTRIVWMDELRFFAFCAVALLHVSGIESVKLGGRDLIVFSTRFAVPVFFMISGFMIGRKERSAYQTTSRTFRRLVPIFLFWEAIYIVVDVAVGGALYPLPEGTIKGLIRFAAVSIYTGGVAFHLWFVVWLAVSTAIFVALRRGGPIILWSGVTTLFLIGCALGPYGEFTGLLQYVGPLTTNPQAYTARNGPFFGPFFLALGCLIAQHNLRASWVRAIALIAAGWGLQVVEGLVIASDASRFVSIGDVVFGTPIFATGVFLAFRNMPEGRFAEHIARLGRLSLGMYCAHAFFTFAFSAVFPPETRAITPIWVSIVGAMAVVAASVLTTLALARVPPLRRFVS